ncbi:sigma-70 family RNA polymerase sigma factor [Mucilaginibacter hurinus]|uniref:Sigma-70 family RNA polymerase sigma factor n=1 Tax=Mucilaginibacter hurinus TaxID=2201324 RepID=A0A367GSR6_9SPHI|nr:sigma-70 family RNA polymerase sigma factor [Mucilaginibacter hurinus]RCH56457.1 sigma-70 family RNA polymerase sigma factor [Mucilaginibacter hurinus]
MATTLNIQAWREELFITLYKKTFPASARYICKMGGTFDDAKDIFQDALVIYYEKVIAGPAQINNSDTAYLLGIARHLWLKRLKHNDLKRPLDNYDFEDEHEQAASANAIMAYLETAGQRCMELLRAFYYDKLAVKDIAALFGYAGERSATVQKYKCLEKVRVTVKQKALTYEDFLE